MSSIFKPILSCSLFLTLFVGPAPVGYAADVQIVEKWLKTNADTHSLKVEFVQARTLKALKNPLVQHGTLWLDYSTNQFRWQLGSPAKTIVVSRGSQIAIMRTPLKRVEFRDSGTSSKGAPGLSGLTKGFPKTLSEFQKEYRVLEISSKGNSYEIVTQPLGPDREGIRSFRFVLDQKRYLLKGLIIDLAEGSTVTTTFQKVVRNPTIEPAVFNPDMTGYKKTKFRR